MNLNTPLWRIIGSGASWLLFAFSFTAFVLGMFAVLAVGGSCAEGGPYEIAVHCPDNANLFTNIGIYGALIAVGIAIVVAREFGMRLIALAWTILFSTLGIVFSLAGGAGIIAGIVFLIMAAIPLLIELHGSVQRVFLGPRDLYGRRFREEPWARASMMFKGPLDTADEVVPTARDWALSLGLSFLPAALGIFLAITWWTA
jgi:hypothetical protein